MTSPEEFFGDDALGLGVYRRVLALLAARGPVETRVSRSQVAFRRRRGFAYLWRPVQYLGARAAGVVVLSVALGRRDPSSRFKEINQVSPRHWMRHLEIRESSQMDDEVGAWLAEAADRAGPARQES